MMWWNLLVAAATLLALSGSVQATTLQITGPQDCGSGSMVVCSSTASFLLVGDNPDPTAKATLSFQSTNITLPQPISGESGGFYEEQASMTGLGLASPLPRIFFGETSQPGAALCRDSPCLRSSAFQIPTGQLDLSLTVSSSLLAESFGGSGPVSVGSPAFTLTLTVPDGLSLEPTPLPAALPLFAAGLGALSLLGWRRKRKARVSLVGVA